MRVARDTAHQARMNDPRLYPRLRAFAIALTGSMRPAAGLARAVYNKLDQGETGKVMSPEDVALQGYREVYMLWLEQTSLQGYREVYMLWLEQTAAQPPEAAGRADPRCFALPAGTHEMAAQYKGLAQAIAGLPAQQRATLLLIYGEGLSYDEAAEVFDTTVQAVMTRAVRGHIAVGHWLDRRQVSAARPDHSASSAPTGGGPGEVAERVA